VTISLVSRTRTLKRIEGGVKLIVEIVELKGLGHESSILWRKVNHKASQ
jgi:hypothetical protein